MTRKWTFTLFFCICLKSFPYTLRPGNERKKKKKTKTTKRYGDAQQSQLLIDKDIEDITYLQAAM